MLICSQKVKYDVSKVGYAGHFFSNTIVSKIVLECVINYVFDAVFD